MPTERVQLLAMSVRLRNDEGTPVDPVPFLVVSLLGVPLLIGWGPVYLLEWGVPLGPAVAISAIGSVGVAVGAYHRYVLTARPEHREEVPAALRLRRLLYGITAGIALLAGLTIAVVFFS